MSTNRATGGSAFPRSEHDIEGLSIRDYFAARILPFCCVQAKHLHGSLSDGDQAGEATRLAYIIADAMLRNRRV